MTVILEAVDCDL